MRKKPFLAPWEARPPVSRGHDSGPIVGHSENHSKVAQVARKAGFPETDLATLKIDSVSRSRVIKAHLLLVLITLICGSTFVLIKQALADASPLLLNAVRMSLAAVLLAAFYRNPLHLLPPPTLSPSVTHTHSSLL